MKELSKEELEKLFNIPFFDYQVKVFNELVKAKNEGKRLIYYPARQQHQHKITDCFNVYQTLNKGIKVNQIFFDEISGR